jgi:predicted peptidase
MLHGGGERSQPNLTLSQNRAILLNQEYVAIWGPGYPPGGPTVQTQWPCFVVVPQVAGSNRFVDFPASVSTYSLAPQPTAPVEMAINIVGLLERQYTQIDLKRLYTTGISMGAFGVWDAIERWPEMFAAAVRVAGAGDPTLAARVAESPIWAVHGSADGAVPVQGSRMMISALRAAGGKLCYTEHNGAGHGIWPQVYSLHGNPNNPLYPWLFGQTTDEPSPGASSLRVTVLCLTVSGL